MRAKENTLWRNKTRSSPAQDVKPKHHEHRQQETLRDVSRKPSLVFIKASKVGGSTVGGVARRIGEQFGLSGTRDRNWISSEPGVWANHREYARVQGRLSRLKGRRFVFAWVRNPVDRCLSAFYHFAVSRNGKEPTDDAIIQHARGCKNDVSKYIGLRRDKGAAEIMAHYDFLGMTERFEEVLTPPGLRWPTWVRASWAPSCAQLAPAPGLSCGEGPAALPCCPPPRTL